MTLIAVLRLRGECEISFLHDSEGVRFDTSVFRSYGGHQMCKMCVSVFQCKMGTCVRCLCVCLCFSGRRGRV